MEQWLYVLSSLQEKILAFAVQKVRCIFLKTVEAFLDKANFDSWVSSFIIQNLLQGCRVQTKKNVKIFIFLFLILVWECNWLYAFYF